MHTTEIDILIANYQSIIRVLSDRVRTLENQPQPGGCYLTAEQCSALEAYILFGETMTRFQEHYGKEKLNSFLSAWALLRERGEKHD